MGEKMTRGENRQGVKNKESRTERQHGSMLKNGISRREFLAGGAAILSVGPFFIPSMAKASSRIVLTSWGGQYRTNVETAFVKPFTKETGIEVIISDTPDFAKAKAQVQSGNVEWDVFDALGPQATAGEKEGMWELIDSSIVDTSNMVLPVSKYVVAWYGWLGGIAWNPKRFPAGKYPVNFKEFWDVQKFPGRRSLRARPQEALEVALVADGVAPRSLYPLDVERAFKSLDRIKPHVPKWAKETQQTLELLRTDEVDFTWTYNTRAVPAKKDGMPIEFSFEQTVIATNYLTVMKGTRNKAVAMQFINFCMRPDRQVHFAEIHYGIPSKKKSLDMVSAEAKKFFADPTNPNHVVLDDLWWRDNYVKLTERFNEWMLT
jgi:putative spermidine/putrescine transport system substrate-binding protein